MKKIIIGSLFAFILMSGVVYANYGAQNIKQVKNIGNSIANPKAVLSQMVEKVLSLNKEGYTKEQITEKLWNGKANYIPKAAKNFGMYKKALRNGDYGEDVKALQRKLNALMSEIGVKVKNLEVDGKYGPATAHLLKMYQMKKGLKADGIAGSNTFQKLGLSLSAVKPFKDVKKDIVSQVTGVGKLVLTAEKTDGGVKLHWNVDGADTSHGFKVVKSKELNPVYPGNDYHYLSNSEIRDNTWEVDGAYHFRVCAYLGGGKCGAYSNDVYVQ